MKKHQAAKLLREKTGIPRRKIRKTMKKQAIVELLLKHGIKIGIR